jgi:hypothetical protein
LRKITPAVESPAAAVVEVGAVFAGGYVGVDTVPHLAQTCQIVGGDGLVKPSDVQFRRVSDDADRLFGTVSAIESGPLGSQHI